MVKKLNISIELTEYDSVEELPEEDRMLVDGAIEASMGAYAPYSNFRVGAALVLDNGEVILGSNQENAAYPSGLCAERVAIFAAGANYPASKIKAIAVTARSDNFIVGDALSPCGGCRQAIAEYEIKQGEPIRIIMAAENGKVLIADSIDSLLPLKFYSLRGKKAN